MSSTTDIRGLIESTFMARNSGKDVGLRGRALYCYTRLKQRTPVKVRFTHIWEHNGKRVFEAQVSIGPGGHISFSYLALNRSSKGRWRVKVVDRSGATISSANFTIR